MMLSYGLPKWNVDVRFDPDHEMALIADVWKFQGCKAQSDTARRTDLLDDRIKKGWIQYDLEGSRDLREVRCVVVGKFERHRTRSDTSVYCILVVEPLIERGNNIVKVRYKRVGAGQVHVDFVVEEVTDVQVV